MENQFTPGPWSVYPDCMAGLQQHAIVENGRALAFVPALHPHAEANSNLISAAPELLEALQAVIMHVNKISAAHGADIYEKMMTHSSIQKAESAINKALNK